MTSAACSWCSEPVGPGASVCPACGAVLVAADEVDLPGLTSVVDRGPVRRRKRNRLIEWLTGNEGEDVGGPTDRLRP